MLFSIITAVYNNKNEIQGAVASVAGQKNVKFEHIIMDGGSNDGTVEIIKANNNPHINFESSRDKGIYDALNKGISKAKGEIVGILHSDDLFNDDQVLEDILAMFEAGYDGVYGDLDYVSKNDTSNIFRHWKAFVPDFFQLQLGWMAPHPALFLKRSVYEEIGNFDLNYKISADYDFILRVFLKKKYKIGYLPRTIVKMRVGGESNRSLKNIIRKSREDFAIASKHFNVPLFTVFFKNFRKIPQFFPGKMN
jgi:glycosyltransferase involved in cell wall biosynthesis